MPTGGSTMLDTIGALIGFAGIMLLLSILVTAMVQTTQDVFRLREKNLKRGLRLLLAHVAGKEVSALTRGLETKILEKSNPLQKLNKSFFSIVGGTNTWIEKDELENVLKEVTPDDEEFPDVTSEVAISAPKLFPRLAKRLSVRLAHFARIIAIVWAVLVAVLFQVDALDLLRRLSTELQFQRRIAEGVFEDAEAHVAGSTSYELSADGVLEQLAENYPELRESIEKASGIETDRDDLVRELSLVLEDAPQADEVIKKYRSLLQERHAEHLQVALQTASEIVGRLAMFDIRPLGNGFAFYYGPGSLSRWLGMVITATLLTFGAPVWCNTLSNLVSLRDVLAPQKGKKVDDEG